MSAHTDLLPRITLDRRVPPEVAAPALDVEQRRVVAHRGGPLLVLAGPGTGKTTTLVEAIVGRLTDPVKPVAAERVLALTFGRRAAGELRDRVIARLGGGVVPTVSTFHSFCYALIRAYDDTDPFGDTPRLLSGPEQETRVRELLAGSIEDGRLGGSGSGWPPSLALAMGTRGMAEEVRAVIARARALGLDPDQLVDLGHRSGQPTWAQVGGFMQEYLDVLDAEGVMDYTELVHRAVLLAESDHVRAALHHRFAAVFVDEYQDTDPAQARLLRALVGPATDLVVVGDPDQSIYAFRGADVGQILEFRGAFPRPTGDPAPVVVLRHTRRFGERIAGAAQALLRSASLAPLPVSIVRAHRSPVPVAAAPGQVEVLTFDDETALAAHTAELIRRAVLESGGFLHWSDVAVIVRGSRSIPVLRRALVHAGVPTEVAGDEVPLRADPAVRPLLDLVEAAMIDGPLGPAMAERLLRSPLGGADTGGLRALRRALRAAARSGVREAPVVESSGVLLAAALQSAALQSAALQSAALQSSARQSSALGQPGLLDAALAGPRRSRAAAQAVPAVRRVARRIAEVRAAIDAGGSAEEVLWAAWAGSAWARRLEAAALAGGEAGRAADRDLDAIVALFASARRAEERFGGRRGVSNFLAEVEHQMIPADTLAEQGVRGPAVRVLTAHRSKGLEWRLVVVVGLQEGEWPDLRHRGSLLGADRMSAGGPAGPTPISVLLAEERRLAYVAATRARERLVIAAVASADDDAGAQASRFVAQLAAGAQVSVTHVSGWPQRPISLPGLVGSWRAILTDPTASPALRAAAAARIARVAVLRDGDRPVAPAADPDHWWGLLTRSDDDDGGADPDRAASVPVRDPDDPVRLSASAVGAILACPLAWFLDRELRAGAFHGTAAGIGSIVHLLAERVATGRVAAEIGALEAELDQVWPLLPFEAPWVADRERGRVRDILVRFLRWHSERPTRTLVAVEQSFIVTLPLGEHGIEVRGSFDRVEIDESGAVHIVDLKTGRSAPSGSAVSEHPQLGVYQRAVLAGALDDVVAVGPDAVPGGAELVTLRVSDGPDDWPRVSHQDAMDSPWIDDGLLAADAVIRSEAFVPRPSAACKRCAFAVLCPAAERGREML